MTKIPVKSLYEYTKQMLKDKWGYIWGTAGIKWTQERQNNTSNEMAQKYGSRWIGHTVADCSGVMVYIWKKFGLSIYHGSNTIARKYCGAMQETPVPGYAAFKWKSTDTAKYSDGAGDYYHIGIVGEDGETVYEAQGTKAGFVTSSASKWHRFAPFKDVDYGDGNNTEDEPEQTSETPECPFYAIVDTDSGYLNMRTGPGTSYKSIAGIDKGTTVKVLTITNGWAFAKVNGKEGYLSMKFLQPITQTDQEEEEQKSDAEADEDENAFTLLEDEKGTKLKIMGRWEVKEYEILD